MQLTAEAATVTTTTVNLREKRPPESIVKILWPQLYPERSDPRNNRPSEIKQ